MNFLIRKFLIVYIALLALLASSAALANEVSHIGLNQKVLIIPVKFSNYATTRLTGTQWMNLFSTTMNPYLAKATNGKTSYTFIQATGAGAPADGWFNLGIPDTMWPGTTPGAVLAMNAARAYLPNLSDVNRVLVITNSPNFGGQTTYWQWMPVPNSVESNQIINGVSTPVRLMCVSAGNEWRSAWDSASIAPWDAACVTMCHELSHQLNLPTHYSDVTWDGNLGRDSISPWDLMGLSPTLNQYLAWAKTERTFIDNPGSRVVTVGPVIFGDIDQTVSIQPISNVTTGTQVIRIPFTGAFLGGILDPFNGYVLEYRKNTPGFATTDYDGNNLAEGILVTLCDEHPEVPYGEKAFVIYNPAFPTDPTKAPLRVGDTFTDAPRGITISVTGTSGSNLLVHIHYTFPPPGHPDPQIIPWGNPPYSTPDIWIDSPKNGYGVLQFNDGAGNAVGQGDPVWVNHDNHVNVRIRNIGPGNASNVRVTVYQNSPPNLGDAGPNWVVIGTIIVPSLPSGAVTTNFITWHPGTDVQSHTCLRAVIQDYPGEISTSNNKAQENITLFETSPGSPYTPYSSTMTVYNPHTTVKHHIIFNVKGIPLGWTWSITPSELEVLAGGSSRVTLKVIPPDPRVTQLKQDQPGNMPKVTVEAFADFEDDYVKIGGTEHWLSLVWPTALRLGYSTANGPALTGNLMQTKYVTQNLASQHICIELKNSAYDYLLYTTTDASGNFNLPLVKGIADGTYTAQAFFPGTGLYHSADSNAVTINLGVALGVNLIANGDAEQGTRAADGSVVPVPVWTITNGLTVVPYGSKGFPGFNDPGPTSRGKEFFAGGPGKGSVSAAVQRIDVTGLASSIDTGALYFNLSAYLGGSGKLSDSAAVLVSFNTGPGGKTLARVLLPAVTPADRNYLIGLLFKQSVGKVPVGTRLVTVELYCTKGTDTYNNGYADNLSLVFNKG